MATKVHMEALSPTMEEGQVVKWRKAEGDEVAKGEVLAEIETDKATMELTARGDGVLARILKREGETAPVGELIAVIAAAGEDISAVVGKGGAGPVSESPKPKSDAKIETGPAAATQAPAKGAPRVEPGEEAQRKPGEEGAPSQASTQPTPSASTPPAPPRPGPAPAGPSRPAPVSHDESGRVKASPLARRLAQEAGVELSAIRGSGPGGRIVKRDIEEASDGGAPAAAAGAAAPPAPTPRAALEGGDFEDVKVSQMRKTIARRLVESIGPVPHFFLTVDVDMDRANQARTRINALLEARGEKISLNDLVIRATAAALRQHPAVNASWQGDHIRRFARAHIGVAVAVDDGLITPVIRDADIKGVAEIAREVRELAGRAREKKLKPAEYTGATFSISNLGMFGIHEFTAVINPPEGGILAVGAVEETPVAMGGQVTVRPRMKVTMSCDHRVIDGATGARFLQTLKAMLEEPAAILL